MHCLECNCELDWVEMRNVRRDKEWIDAGIISKESGDRGMSQPAAVYRCPNCETEFEAKFFTFKNQPGDAEDPERVARICQEHGILGLGWGGSPITGAKTNPSSGEEVAAVFDDHFDGKIRSDNRDFVIWMERGDFVFTYDHHREDSKYFQTRVTGDVQTPHSPDAMLHGEPLNKETRAELLRQDINLYREATWKEISPRDLPGPLNRDVPIKQGTIRKIKSNLTSHVAQNAVSLWDDELVSTQSDENLHEKLSNATADDAVDCLNETELEEVVSSMLQRQEDAVMQLNTALSSQPNTESILRTVRSGTSHVIYFQVKSNTDPSNLGQLGKAEDESLFVYAGGKDGSTTHAEYLTNNDIYRYLIEQYLELPPGIRNTLNRQL